VRAGLLEIDERLESSLDSYAHDDLPETVGTAEPVRPHLARAIGATAPALEEKESAVLLAADLLWALMHTDGPVVLVSDRPDLVALLDVMDDHFVERARHEGARQPRRSAGRPVHRRGHRGRPLRIDHALADGPADRTDDRRPAAPGRRPEGGVESGAARSGPDDDGSSPTDVAEAIAYDPVLHSFTVKDLDGRRAGEVSLRDIIQFPVDGVSLMALDDEASAMTLRTLLAASLRLHLDLRVPLPSARLTRRSGERLVGASIALRARGRAPRRRGRRAGDEQVALRRGLEARIRSRAVPASGTVVEIVVTTTVSTAACSCPTCQMSPMRSVARGRPGSSRASASCSSNRSIRRRARRHRGRRCGHGRSSARIRRLRRTRW
jgi:hypothetical protein